MPKLPHDSRVALAFLAIAMIAAPFLAVAYRPEAGLLVMAVGLFATASLLSTFSAVAAAQGRRWLRLAMLIDLGLALACLVLFVALVF